jgi:HTH-type transcriptional regulator / antitoxin MqsA
MNKCFFCGGKVVNEQVAFVYEEKSSYFFVEHVPAEVCSTCGEKNYAPAVADELLKYAKRKSRPANTLKVPVFNFAAKTF